MCTPVRGLIRARTCLTRQCRPLLSGMTNWLVLEGQEDGRFIRANSRLLMTRGSTLWKSQELFQIADKGVETPASSDPLHNVQPKHAP